MFLRTLLIAFVSVLVVPALAQDAVPAQLPKPETRSLGIKPSEISQRLRSEIQACWMPPAEAGIEATTLRVSMDAEGGLIGAPEVLVESPLTASAVRAVQRCAPYTFVTQIVRNPGETFAIDVTFQP